MQGETLFKDFPAIDAIIKKYDERKEFLICILQDLQARYGYLPKEALKRVAEKLDIPYYMTSAKSGLNVQNAFQKLAETCAEYFSK